MLPAAQAAEVVSGRGAEVAQREAAALRPDEALRVRGLQLAVDAQQGAVGVDGDLRVEQREAVWGTLGDAQVDGHAGGAAGGLDAFDLVAVFDDDALFGVLGEGAGLFEGRVAFDKVLVMDLVDGLLS